MTKSNATVEAQVRLMVETIMHSLDPKAALGRAVFAATIETVEDGHRFEIIRATHAWVALHAIRKGALWRYEIGAVEPFASFDESDGARVQLAKKVVVLADKYGGIRGGPAAF